MKGQGSELRAMSVKTEMERQREGNLNQGKMRGAAVRRGGMRSVLKCVYVCALCLEGGGVGALSLSSTALAPPTGVCSRQEVM